jgi:GR25 family glycosyltransferase involved in LPS biosynthesis
MDKYIIFHPSGRLGNAIFRYLGCIMFIQKDPELKYILNDEETQIKKSEYTYYHGQDFVGNDVSNKKLNSVEEYKIFCNTNSAYHGFNTLGYIKTNIDTSNLKSNEYINPTTKHGIYVKNNIQINDETFLEKLHKINETNKMNIIMSGYDGWCQFDNIYLENKQFILNYIEEHKHEHYIKTDTNIKFLMKDIVDDIVLDQDKIYDTVIHIRLDDFNGRPDFIEYEYLEKVLETANSNLDFSKKNAIVIEEPKREIDKIYLQNVLDWFKKREIQVNLESTNSLMIDFNIMKQAKVVISSMSTLCWAAAYFSKVIEKCYMPNYNFQNNPVRRYTMFKHPIENTVLFEVKTTPIKVDSKIKIIVITLEKYSFRLQKLLPLLQKLNIPYELSYGVLGTDINIYDTQNNNIKRLEYKSEIKYHDSKIQHWKQFTIGEFGCAWAHLNVYKKLLEDKEYTNYLILEDDVDLIISIEYLQYILQNTPTHYDMIHFGKSIWYPFILQKKINNYYFDIKKQFFNAAYSYMLSTAGAQKIIDYAKNTINVPADDLLSNMHIQNKLDVYVPLKHFFVETPNTISSIGLINNYNPLI